MLDLRIAAYGAFLLRLALGVAAMSHGLTKLLVFTPAGTVAFFGSLGYPEWLAWGVVLIETLGGVADFRLLRPGGGSGADSNPARSA